MIFSDQYFFIFKHVNSIAAVRHITFISAVELQFIKALHVGEAINIERY